jgi:hypothetical protein
VRASRRGKGSCRGRWRGVLSKGFGPDGKRRRYKVGGQTKQDIIEALKKKTQELDAGLSTSRSYTASRAAYDWLEHGLPIGMLCGRTLIRWCVCHYGGGDCRSVSARAVAALVDADDQVCFSCITAGAAASGS